MKNNFSFILRMPTSQRIPPVHSHTPVCAENPSLWKQRNAERAVSSTMGIFPVEVTAYQTECGCIYKGV